MKRLWISVILLVLIFSITLWNVSYLSRFVGQVTSLLTDAETLAERGDWAGAWQLTDKAKSIWEGREPYLYITLIHSDTDEIYVGFREVLKFIEQQEDGEYSAANAHLIAKLELLHEMDELTLQNIL